MYHGTAMMAATVRRLNHLCSTVLCYESVSETADDTDNTEECLFLVCLILHFTHFPSTGGGLWIVMYKPSTFICISFQIGQRKKKSLAVPTVFQDIGFNVENIYYKIRVYYVLLDHPCLRWIWYDFFFFFWKTTGKCASVFCCAFKMRTLYDCSKLNVGTLYIVLHIRWDISLSP